VQDVRVTALEGGFHLILCRHLVFTGFDGALQRRVVARLAGGSSPAWRWFSALPSRFLRIW